MLFTDHLAIGQLTHAWISGQILRAWAEPLDHPLLLAAEQHDIGWLDWETEPTFDPRTGRPHLFRDIGAHVHAPMWTRGVDRALAAWGTHVALLISRHGGVIYRRFSDRHRIDPADADAADRFIAAQAPREAEWAGALGLDEVTLARQTALLALSDTLSLALCGELQAPLDIEADGRTYRLQTGGPGSYTLSPWPFRADEVLVKAQARVLPPGGRLPDEAAMQAWLARSEREPFRVRLLESNQP